MKSYLIISIIEKAVESLFVRKLKGDITISDFGNAVCVELLPF